MKDFLQGNVTEYVVHGHGSDGARIVGRSSSRMQELTNDMNSDFIFTDVAYHFALVADNKCKAQCDPCRL